MKLGIFWRWNIVKGEATSNIIKNVAVVYGVIVVTKEVEEFDIAKIIGESIQELIGA